MGVKRFIPLPLWNSICRGYYGLSDALFPRPRFRSIPYRGFTLWYGPGMDIAKRLDKDGYFEKDLCERISTSLRSALNASPDPSKSPVLLDVGANIGLISLAAAAEVPGAIIHTFEPGPAQRAFLEKNVRENGLSSRVTVHSEAASESDGTAIFTSHHPDFGSNDGFFDTHRAGRSFATKTITVQTMKLDTWWQSAGKPNVTVLKIDTEGAELMVLRGATQMIAACHPNIFLEISELNLKSYPYKPADISNFFEKASYALEQIDEVSFVAVSKS